MFSRHRERDKESDYEGKLAAEGVVQVKLDFNA